MDQDALAQWKARDPLNLLRSRLDERAAVNIEKSVDKKLEEAVDFAKNSPEPSVEDFLADLHD